MAVSNFKNNEDDSLGRWHSENEYFSDKLQFINMLLKTFNYVNFHSNCQFSLSFIL